MKDIKDKTYALVRVQQHLKDIKDTNAYVLSLIFLILY